MTKKALPCTGNQEWNTPARIIEAARRAMGGIDCDPASNDEAQKTVQASVYYTKDANGLAREWDVRKWMNPRPCYCNVQPLVLQSIHGNANLYQMQSRETKNTGVFFGEDGQWREEDSESVQEMHCGTFKEVGRETKEEMPKVRRTDEQKQHKNVQIMLGGDAREEPGEKMHKVQEGAPVHCGKLPKGEGAECLGILVQAVPKGSRKDQAEGAQGGSRKEEEAFGGEVEIQQKRERTGAQETKLYCEQQQAEAEKIICSMVLDDGDMGENKNGMGRSVRLLRENWKDDARSLYSAFESGLSRNGSMEHGSCVSRLQREQGKSHAGGLVHGQESICPNCGVVGVSTLCPSKVFLNPPYSSKLLTAFIRAFFREYLGGRARQACILINNNTDTAGCQALLRTADSVCFVKGRLRFGGKSAGQPLQGQVVFYFGPDRARFLDAFRTIGVCMEAFNVPEMDLFRLEDGVDE